MLIFEAVPLRKRAFAFFSIPVKQAPPHVPTQEEKRPRICENLLKKL